MIRRKGFKKFHQKLSGLNPTYPLPGEIQSDLFLRKNIEPHNLRWVIDAFTWSTSSQGVAFWNEIHSGRGDRDLACEILRDWKEQLHG